MESSEIWNCRSVHQTADARAPRAWDPRVGDPTAECGPANFGFRCSWAQRGKKGPAKREHLLPLTRHSSPSPAPGARTLLHHCATSLAQSLSARRRVAGWPRGALLYPDSESEAAAHRGRYLKLGDRQDRKTRSRISAKMAKERAREGDKADLKGEKRRAREGDKADLKGEKKRAREGDEADDPTGKKRKVEDLLNFGHSTSINERHRKQFELILALIMKSKSGPNATDDMLQVLDAANASLNLFFEWERETDRYYLWISKKSKDIKIKLEVTAVFDDSKGLKVKNAVLAFSEGFDYGDGWGDIKATLQELFGTLDICIDKDPDYLYAFTRIRDRFQLRVFEINSTPTFDEKNITLKGIMPIFIMKPTEINSSQNNYVFFDEDKFSITQRNTSSVLHAVEHQKLKRIRLEVPLDLSQWEGYNSNLTEYFERYCAFKKTKVPGTGQHALATMETPEAEYTYICLPFKMFARSLLIRCKEAFDNETCFESIGKRKIFFRGNTLGILKVKLVKYTEEKAKANLSAVADLIRTTLVDLHLKFKDFPSDLKKVLALLKSKHMDLQMAMDNVAWMDESKQLNLINDMYQQFGAMSPLQQIKAGKNFPILNELQDGVDKNWLIYYCRTHRVDAAIKATSENLRKYFKDHHLKLLWMPGINRWNSMELNKSLQYYRALRNCEQHMLDAGKAFGLGNLTRKQSALIVFSQFADVVAKMQVGMIEACQSDEKARMRSNFGSYFPDVSSVIFDKDDRK